MFGVLMRPSLRWLRGSRRSAALRAARSETGAAWCRVGRDGVVRYITPASRLVVGPGAERAADLRHALRDVLRPVAPALLDEWLEQCWEADETAPIHLEVEAAAGETRRLELSTPGRLGVSEAQTVVVEIRDAGTRAAREQRAHMLATALDTAAEPALVMEAGGTLVYVNAAFARLLGLAEQDLLDRSFRMLLAEPESDDLLDTLWDEVGRNLPFSGEVACRRGDGSLCTLELTVSPLPEEASTASRCLVLCRDVSSRKRSERELQDLAFYDPLTGLANPRLMRERARQMLALARRNGSLAALLHIDLDHFSAVNRQFGRSTGDEALRMLAERLRQGLRESDSLARIGSDEFLVLLSDVSDEQSIARIARRLHDSIQRPVRIRDYDVCVTPRVGIALYPRDASCYDELLSCADAAVRRAQRGGSPFEFFEPELSAAGHEGLSLEDDLHWAWENDQFLLHYQPIIGADGEVVGAEALARPDVIGVEALARWPHTDRGMVGPSQFIPVAERTGRIVSLDRWAIATAAKQAAAWARTGWSGWVSVNLSARSLHDPDLPEYVARVLAAHQLERGRLVVEITEGTAMRDPVLTAHVLHGLRTAGALIAVDDFGVGHSSLAYLKLFPVDLLKLDACFVRELGTGSRDEQLVEIMIALAQRIGARVVAEGVEEERQLEWLKRAGCDFIQGFLIGRPAPPQALGTPLQQPNS